MIYAGILDAYVCLYTLKACVCHFFNAVCTSSPALREATVMNTAPGAPTTARCVMLVVDVFFYCEVIGDFLDFVASRNAYLFSRLKFCLSFC